jgi:hypothetical protein
MIQPSPKQKYQTGQNPVSQATAKSVRLTAAERAAVRKEQSANANPEPNMMMLNRDLVLRLAKRHRLAITIRPDGSIFGLQHHLDKLRALVKRQPTRPRSKKAGGAA